MGFPIGWYYRWVYRSNRTRNCLFITLLSPIYRVIKNFALLSMLNCYLCTKCSVCCNIGTLNQQFLCLKAKTITAVRETLLFFFSIRGYLIPHYLELFMVIWIAMCFAPFVHMIFEMEFIYDHCNSRHPLCCWSQFASNWIASIFFKMACIIIYNSI